MKSVVKVLYSIFFTLSLLGCNNEISRNILQTQTPTSIIFPSKNDCPTILDEGYLILLTREDSDQDSSYVDLDRGCYLGAGYKEHADIKLDIGCGSDCFTVLLPVNGAMNYFLHEEGDEFSQCVNNLPLFTHGSAPDFWSGDPICIFTDGGRIAVLTYVNIGCTYGEDLCVIFHCIVWEDHMGD